jgi:error-prone DNA polymerase
MTSTGRRRRAWSRTSSRIESIASDDSLPWRQLIDILQRIAGTPRHLSIHVGGMLVTGEPLIDVVPVERATMPGRVVVQFDKDDVEDLGLIKMDLLGLRTLSAIAECLDLIERSTGVRPDLDALPLDDPAVYDMICRVDTIGLFQIESRAQQQSLWQSQPRCFNDLIVQVAISRQGLEPVTYAHPSLEPILKETRGVILYQEQILRIVMEVAGYTAGEADRFRRAMNRHRSRIEMEGLRDEFLQRCLAHGLDEPTADTIFRSAAGFAQFGFCKSHAAAFARTAYETAWLRLYHPAQFLCALLNAQPMGFYHPSVLIDDARRRGVRVLPVDVTRSRARCTVEPLDDNVILGGEDTRPLAQTVLAVDGAHSERLRRPSLAPTAAELAAAMCPPRSGAHSSREFGVRLGFAYVRGLGPAGRAACDDAINDGANSSIETFWRHTLLPRRAMEHLVRIGAFDNVEPRRKRRELLWELQALDESLPKRRRTGGEAPKAASSGPPRGRGAVAGARLGDAVHVPRDPSRDELPPVVDLPAPSPQLPDMDERTRVLTEYALTEVSTGPHLVSFVRTQLDALRCMPLARVRELADGARVRTAGLVITRQAPSTASGFRFFTLADEDTHLDLVLRPAVAAATRDAARHPLLMVEGTVQVESGRVNVVVQRLIALDGEGRPLVDPRRAPTAAPPSHDFR